MGDSVEVRSQGLAKTVGCASEPLREAGHVSWALACVESVPVKAERLCESGRRRIVKKVSFRSRTEEKAV